MSAHEQSFLHVLRHFGGSVSHLPELSAHSSRHFFEGLAGLVIVVQPGRQLQCFCVRKGSPAWG